MTDLRKELRDLMENRGLSLSSVSRALGISTAALSQWLSNQYVGNIAKIDDSVKGFLQREKERLNAPKKTIEFVITSVARKVFEVARLCHLDREIGVIYGDAGLGKTMSVKEYARKNSDVILIEADLGYTAKMVFLELHRRLGMDGRGSIHEMFEDVVSKVKDSGRLIIVDEAEHLPYRALELLRRIYDKAGIGILLAGMPRLIANLRGKKGEYAQLYSRIGVAGRLERLKEKDTEEIVSSVIPSANGLCKVFYEASLGNTRILSKLILRATRVASLNNISVTADIVRETAKMLII
ncbi:MAG: AAA family ATPase [Nitrospinae bacterium]|nr:AAA family ATPase [Nitrospinota bacterium]